MSPTTPTKTPDTENTNSDELVNVHGALASMKKEIAALLVKIASAGTKPSSEVSPWMATLKEKNATYLALTEALDLLNSDGASSAANGTPVTGVVAPAARSVVPHDLPTFQWPGFVEDKSLRIYDDIEHCLSRFQNVLKSHGLDCDSHWFRLLPLCLSPGLGVWLDEFIQGQGGNASWKTLKTAMVARYGAPKEQLRFARVGEFLGCTRLEGELLDVFLERFKDLRARAEVTDKHVVAKIFFDAFPPAVSRLMLVSSMGQAPESAFYDLDYLFSVARRLDVAVDKRLGKVAASTIGGASKKRDAESSNMPVSAEAKKSKWYVAPAEPARGGNKGEWVSKFGKTMAEHRADGTCKDCNNLYGKNHRCGSAIRSGSAAAVGEAKVLRMMHKRRPMGPMIDAALDSEVGRLLLEERRGAFAGSVVGEDAKPASVLGGSPVVSAATEDSDVEMSESNGHSVGDEADLRMRAESSLVDGMASVAVEDADLLINLSAQQCKFDALFSAPPAMM